MRGIYRKAWKGTYNHFSQTLSRVFVSSKSRNGLIFLVFSQNFREKLKNVA